MGSLRFEGFRRITNPNTLRAGRDAASKPRCERHRPTTVYYKHLKILGLADERRLNQDAPGTMLHQVEAGKLRSVLQK